jgi:hypothetical protein
MSSDWVYWEVTFMENGLEVTKKGQFPSRECSDEEGIRKELADFQIVRLRRLSADEWSEHEKQETLRELRERDEVNRKLGLDRLGKAFSDMYEK